MTINMATTAAETTNMSITMGLEADPDDTISMAPTVAPAVAGGRNSQEPLRKRQRKATASPESLVVGDCNDNELSSTCTPRPAVSRSQSPALTRSVTRGKSATPRRSPRGKTPVVKSDSFITNGDNIGFSPRTSSKDVSPTINGTKLDGATMELPQPTKPHETTIQVEGIPYEEGEDEEDYKDFMPENPQSGSPAMRNGNGTVSSRRSARSAKQAEAINKVKSGRISKFKEGSMNDRVSTRPPAELIGYAYANRKAGSQPGSEAGASQSTSGVTTTTSKSTKSSKPTFPARKYTGDEVFTFGGFISSVFQFRGIEYCKENWWGPRKQKILDKVNFEVERFKQQRELDEIKAKAEAVYRQRKQREWNEMETKKQMATEELRRRKQKEMERKERQIQIAQKRANGQGTAGFKRKYGEMAESFGEDGEDRVWDEVERAAERQLEEEAEATDVDDDVERYDGSELPLELARQITGKDIVAQQVPSRPPSVAASLQASPRRRRFHAEESMDQMVFSQECEVPQFDHYSATAEHSDEESDHAGCRPFVMKGAINDKGKAPTRAPSESGASSNGNSNRNGSSSKGKSLQAALKNHASKVFGGVVKVGQVNTNGSAKSGSSVSGEAEVPDRKFTKKELQKQERLKKKVVDLESRLLDTWRELEAVGGTKGLKVNPPQPIQPVPSSSARTSMNGSVNGEHIGVGADAGVVNGTGNGNGCMVMGPPPVPVGKRTS
ncbi:hypothetical protein L211DRAFT_717247 [Terfezia boudieri ATCC MYA-4762]|uniref:Uncharacterized protein n=1 Tax=Terfezia boudieri ATCC MYA-4762 TaxID=1051890 RepID=A0A3N4M0D7_9PEZI|nr:hypothetical protein L211DRAFT_717247 [Terfezia boudieri ATCC MYA-4762]